MDFNTYKDAEKVFSNLTETWRKEFLKFIENDSFTVMSEIAHYAKDNRSLSRDSLERIFSKELVDLAIVTTDAADVMSALDTMIHDKEQRKEKEQLEKVRMEKL